MTRALALHQLLRPDGEPARILALEIADLQELGFDLDLWIMGSRFETSTVLLPGPPNPLREE